MTKDTSDRLRKMGVVVESVSVPLHHTGIGIWVLSVLPSLVRRLFYSKEMDPLLGLDEHSNVCDRLTFLRSHPFADAAR